MNHDACSFCGTPYKPSAGFCASCGQRRIDLGEPSELRFVIKFFIAMLAVMLPGIIYVVHLDGGALETDVILSSGLLLVTFGFALARRPLWTPLYKTVGFGPLGFLLIVLAAPVVLALVAGYVEGLSKMFGIHTPNELEPFEGRHILWPIVLMAILPPLVEELAFRGLIFTGLRKSLGVSESFIISSFAFALLHLSVPSLITHLPLGLYFCYLRYRAQSLWPPMLAHALHNGGVILLHYLR